MSKKKHNPNNNIKLNSEQQKILEQAHDWFYNSSEQVFEISGPAGTGKSFLMYQILRDLKLSESEIYPMAYTGQASIVMRTKGFTTAKSIHSTLYETYVYYDDDDINSKFGTPVKKFVFRKKLAIDPEIKLFFIDEAYMVPNFMVKDILSFGVKVIACGDANQLPPIGDQPGFLTGYNVHYLTQLMRQSEKSPIVYLANRAMRGLPIHNGMYGNDVLVCNDDEFCPEMIGFADCIACGTNRTRDELNNYVRSLVGFAGSELPRCGERLICRNNNWGECLGDIALTNGLCGTVLNNPGVESFSKSKKYFKIDFAPDLCETYFSNLHVNYEYFVSDRDRKNELKSEKKEFVPGDFFEFAYALTTHLVQGSEYNNGIYVEEFLKPQIQNQLNYTGITRFKHKLIYIRKRNNTFYIPLQYQNNIK